MEFAAPVAPPYVGGPLRLEPFRAQMLAPPRIGDPAAARALARPYRDVGERLRQWREQANLWHDPQQALYVHEYTAAGITIRGLVGLLDVSQRARSAEERAILPHEGIYPAQADELAARMEEMRLNPAPILLAHRADPALRALVQHAARTRPVRDYRDRAGQQHRIWAVRDQARLDAVATAIAPARALIADGHHRYAAYLRLFQRHHDRATRVGLAMLVDQDDTPLFLGAIHRVLTDTTVADVASAAGSLSFAVTETDRHAAIGALGPHTIVATDGLRWAAVEVPDHPDRAEGTRLPVEVLHQDLVPALPRGPSRIAFHHQAGRALAQARPGNDVALLLPAPSIGEVMAVAAQDRLLPEKATSFQPKPSLGSLMRSLDE